MILKRLFENITAVFVITEGGEEYDHQLFQSKGQTGHTMAE